MLEQDIDRLGNWARDWKMQFNIDKCKVMHYGKDNIAFKYSLYGQQLAEVSSEKDLGVTFSSDLKVNIQCRKASQALDSYTEPSNTRIQPSFFLCIRP